MTITLIQDNKVLNLNQNEAREILMDILGLQKEKETGKTPAKERMTRQQAAKYLQCTPQTITNHTKAGRLKKYGTGKGYYLVRELNELDNQIQ
jgi:ERCC4-related helicase